MPPNLKSRLGEFIDYFTTTSGDPIRLQRERVVVGSAFMLVAVALVFLWVWVFRPSQFDSGINPISCTIAFSTLVGISIPFVVKRTGALGVAATILAVSTVGTVAVAAAYNSGFRGLSMAWMTIVPLYMGFVVSPRAGWLAACGVILLEGTFGLMTGLHYDFPVVMTNDERLLGDVLAAMTAASFAAAFTAFYESSREDALSEKRRLEYENEELAELNRLKSEFVAMISHELRTPLNAIIGFSRIVMNKAELDDRNQENVEKIHYSGQHLLQIVDELLELESIEAGRLKIERVELDLGTLVAESVETSRLRAEAKGLKLVCEEGAELTLCSDPKRLRQITDNLVTNAIKYSKSGTIAVRTYRDQDRAVLEVEDEGIGIPEDQLGLIFAPFRQVDRSEARTQQGVGLGLYLVQQMVDALGGEISVESVEGEGTTFRVHLAMPDS